MYEGPHWIAGTLFIILNEPLDACFSVENVENR